MARHQRMDGAEKVLVRLYEMECCVLSFCLSTALLRSSNELCCAIEYLRQGIDEWDRVGL